jgi:hypothetical protein
VNFITWKNISRHLPIFTSHSVNLWDMIRRTVGTMISCMKGQGTHTKFKERCRRRELLRSLILEEEETSTLVVDSEEEDEEEAWVEVNVRSFCYNVPSQVTWKGTIRTLVPLASTATHLNMLLKIVQYCWRNFRKDQGGNQQVRLISVEPRRVDHRVIFITRGGIVRGEDRVTPEKTT